MSTGNVSAGDRYFLPGARLFCSRLIWGNHLERGENTFAFDAGPIYAKWSDGTEALWETPFLGKGFKVTNGDVTFADDYDRMWPDTWSGQKKIYFFSWDGTSGPGNSRRIGPR